MRICYPPACLATAIVPRRREKSARHQFSPLGRNGLSDNIQFCNPPSRGNSVAGPYRAYLPARWKGKAYTSAMSVPLKVVGRRSPRWIAEPLESSEARVAQSTFHSRMLDAACSLAPVWMVRTICQHRPYRPMAHRQHCMSGWKVFFLTDWFSCPVSVSPLSSDTIHCCTVSDNDRFRGNRRAQILLPVA